MAAPASALSALADLAVDGATVAALALVAVVAMRSIKIMRQQIFEEVMIDAMERTEYQYTFDELADGYLDSAGNLYETEAERDEAEERMNATAVPFSKEEKDSAWDEAVEASRVEFNGEVEEGENFEEPDAPTFDPQPEDSTIENLDFENELSKARKDC
jgi:hypothetical protein